MCRLGILVLLLVASAYSADINERIVGGTDAPDAAYPYQVSLRTGNSHFCGGSIVNEEWILTAAHCVWLYQFTPSIIRVVVGTNQLDQGGEVYRATTVIIHPSFNLLLIRNDVALIRVSNPITYGRRVQPVTLPTEDFVKIDYPAVLTGWGNDGYPDGVAFNNLQHIVLNIIDQKICLARSIRTTARNICTFTVYGEGACHGDSGGPLVADGVQVGIVSWGTPCAVGDPDVFARVWSFIDWIHSNTAL